MVPRAATTILAQLFPEPRRPAACAAHGTRFLGGWAITPLAPRSARSAAARGLPASAGSPLPVHGRRLANRGHAPGDLVPYALLALAPGTTLRFPPMRRCRGDRHFPVGADPWLVFFYAECLRRSW